MFRDIKLVIINVLDFFQICFSVGALICAANLLIFADLVQVFDNTAMFNPPNCVVVSAAERLRHRFAHMVGVI